MKRDELIALLQTMPEDADVEVNDNNGGEVYPIVQVDYFPADEYDGARIIVLTFGNICCIIYTIRKNI